MKIQENLSNKNKAKTIILLLFIIIILALGGYFLMQKMSEKPAPINKETPQIKNNFKYYKIINNTAYYEDKEIQSVDILTFQELEDRWAKDKNHVFYGGEELKIKIDPDSFTILREGVIKDNKRVYFFDKFNDKYVLISNVDAPTFQYIGICESVEKSLGFYFKDKNYVFIGDEPAYNIDVSTFEYFGNYLVVGGIPYSVSYAKDKNSIYHSCGEILEDADKITFINLGDGYAKDKNKVWYLAGIIEEADTKTFQALEGNYAKDKNHAYFDGSIIKNADAASFAVVKEKVPEEDKGNEIFYAKDKNNVYSGSEIVKGVNPEKCTPESIKECEPDSDF